MDSNRKQPDVSQLYDRLKKFGYAESKQVKIYGQEYRVVSDPFPEANGVAVKVVSETETEARTVQIPRPIVEMANR